MITNTTLRKAMREIAAKKGDFVLFARFLRSDALGTWDLVVAAPWLEKGGFSATTELVKLLSGSIGVRALRYLARVEAVRQNDPNVQSILANFPVDDGELRVRNLEWVGLQIDDAVIFRAKKPSAKPNGPSKALHPVVARSGRGRARPLASASTPIRG